MPTTSSSTPLSSGSQTDAHSLRHLGARKKFNLSEIHGVGGGGGGGGAGGVAGGAVAEGVAMVGGASSHMRISGSGSSISGGALVGGVLTPVKEREQSSLVSLVCTVYEYDKIILCTTKMYVVNGEEPPVH